MNNEMGSGHQQFKLPGFRFHPTEEELLDFYLKNVIYSKKLRFDIIGYLNIYHHDPWELPGLSKIGEREWYFFVPRDRKHGAGGRPNRTTAKGFWKATGSDRKIVTLSDPKRMIGLRKTLVFYQGRAPRGSRTDWVMNEYRLPDSCEDIVLCKIYRKATTLKVLEQRAAMEEQNNTIDNNIVISPPTSSSSMDSNSHHNKPICYSQQEESMPIISPMPFLQMVSKNVEDDNNFCNRDEIKPILETNGSSLKLSMGKDIKLPELQLPKISMDWNPDNFLLNSPWPQCLTPFANILNF